jgi:holo-[acyl-carrier protein] synthase
MQLRILGLGVDLVEVGRLERAVARHGEGFLLEFLSPVELDRCRREPHLLPSCSAFFAAKEAFFKAFGTGRSGHLRWQDVEIQAGGANRNAIELSGATREEAERTFLERIHLSMSQPAGRGRGQMALAMVVLEGRAEVGGFLRRGGEDVGAV